jgi:3'-phosphoadenosine 5'-phosphosulfate (PAPS) 3'-phosphatase
MARSLCDALGVRRYVECGSIALKICRVADGTADLFVKDVVVRDWDLAPAHLVLLAAGGILTDFRGEAIVYRGGMEKYGLVATASQDLADAVQRARRQEKEHV